MPRKVIKYGPVDDDDVLEEIRGLLYRIEGLKEQAYNAARDIKDPRKRNWALGMVECDDPEMTLEDADEGEWS